MTAAVNIDRTFTNYDLHSAFYGSTLGRYDLESLEISKRGAWLLQAILPLYRQGAGVLQVTLAALADTAARVAGYGYSLRTTRSALGDLEAAGLIARRNYRHGGELRIVLRDTLADLLSRDKLNRTSPKPSHTQPHRQKFPGGRQKGTGNTIVPFDSLVFSSNQQNDPPARIDVEPPPPAQKPAPVHCEKKTKPGKADHKFDPVVYSIRCVCENRFRGVLTAIANREIATGNAASGIEWGYWRARWQGMGIDQREFHAKRDLVPVLLRYMRNPDPIQNELRFDGPETPAIATNEQSESGESAEIISGRILESLRSAAAAPSPIPSPAAAPADPPIDTDADPVLIAAADRARKRRADLVRWERQSTLATLQRGFDRTP